VIASGPTAADSSTFADALAVLDRFDLKANCPPLVVAHLEHGAAGKIPETPKTLPANVHNIIIGNNSLALRAATVKAESLGYRVLNVGSFVEGEPRQVAIAAAGIVRSIRSDGLPIPPPACILVGGETTVTLESHPGKGGRNQEFVLAAVQHLGGAGMRGTAI